MEGVGMPVREVADATAPAITLGLIFGRVGCFLGGCCYGAVCDPAWWTAPPPWYPPPTGGVPRYPTALLSVAFALVLFLALRAIYRRRAFAGEAFLALFVLYAPGRFLIESLRADPRGEPGGLSTTQLLVLPRGARAGRAGNDRPGGGRGRGRGRAAAGARETPATSPSRGRHPFASSQIVPSYSGAPRR